MSKQRPTPDKIANELAGASAFFKRPTPAPTESAPPQPPAVEATSSPPSTPVQIERPPCTPRTPVRPAKRQMIRHPFELYMDQLDSLRELADAQRRRGELGSMSRMVRQAIDRFLDEHPNDDE